MQKIIKKSFSAPSIRLNTLVVIEIVMLHLVSLGGLFYFTRKALVEEAMKDAEQRLEGTVQHVDNVLLSVEQTTGNFYYELIEHLDNPSLLETYCHRLVVSNPNVEGCAIAFKPDYFTDRKLCMTYVHRKKYNSPELVSSKKATKTPYTRQKWFQETLKTCKPAWRAPESNNEFLSGPIITFCLPIHDYDKECIGVMAVSVSINLLSQIVLETKTTPNSYSIMLNRDGTYIVHPNAKKLAGQKIQEQRDIADSPSALEAVKTMLNGEAGDISFSLNNEELYMFYKPFIRSAVPGRSTEDLKWSIATLYPMADIFGEYNHLVMHVLTIVIVGLLVFWILCRIAIRTQLKPLSVLTESAQSIAEGTYTTIIPDTERNDEIGQFQKYFKRMQQSLMVRVKEKRQLTEQLEKRRNTLQEIHKQIREDGQVRDTFLHNVTNRMISPAESILKSVMNISNNYLTITQEEAKSEVENIKMEREKIMILLSKKFDVYKKEIEKEDSHE